MIKAINATNKTIPENTPVGYCLDKTGKVKTKNGVILVKPFTFKGREKQYRQDYRTSHKEGRKPHDKAYNRQYYLAHKGKNVKNPRKDSNGKIL